MKYTLRTKIRSTKFFLIIAQAFLLLSCSSESKSGIKGNENDDNKIIVGDNSKIDESTTHIHNYPEGNTGKLEKGVQMLNSFDPDQMHIGNLLFPLEVIDFISELGEPTEIFLFPPDGLSGPGNSCKWNFSEKNISLSVVTNDYSSDKLDYNAKINWFSVRLIERRGNSDISLPLQTYLGMPHDVLLTKLETFVKDNSFWKLMRYGVYDEYRNWIENGDIVITNGKFFLTFRTNGKKLIQLDQSTFNPYMAN